MTHNFIDLQNGYTYSTTANESNRIRKCEDVLIAKDGNHQHKNAYSSEHKLAANHMRYFKDHEKRERLQLMKQRLEAKKMKNNK